LIGLIDSAKTRTARTLDYVRNRTNQNKIRYNHNNIIVGFSSYVRSCIGIYIYIYICIYRRTEREKERKTNKKVQKKTASVRLGKTTTEIRKAETGQMKG